MTDKRNKALLLKTGDLLRISDASYKGFKSNFTQGLTETFTAVDLMRDKPGSEDKYNLVNPKNIVMLIGDLETYLNDLVAPPGGAMPEGNIPPVGSSEENPAQKSPGKKSAGNFTKEQTEDALKENRKAIIKEAMGKNMSHVTRKDLLVKLGLEDEGQTRDDLFDALITTVTAEE